MDEKTIIFKISNKEIGAKELTDSGICPTCFDREHNNILYGNKDKTMLYEDDDIECFLDMRPKAIGHIIISSKLHYKDMMEIPDTLCNKVFLFSRNLMIILKKVYECESVYLCTMCDGKMNHFHIQLIPRYQEEKRGSINFVKERKKYVYDKDKIEMIKNLLKNNNDIFLD